MHMRKLSLIWMLFISFGLVVGCGGSGDGGSGDGDPGGGETKKQYSGTPRQQRTLHMEAVKFADEHGDMMPESLGHLLVAGGIEPAILLTPWSGHAVPDGIDGWDDEKKIEWANTHSGYVYLAGGKKAEFDSKRIVLFALPPNAEVEKVTSCYDDNRSLAQPFAAVDAEVKAQTGHGIADWLKSPSPGSGTIGSE